MVGKTGGEFNQRVGLANPIKSYFNKGILGETQASIKN
jgi:hypothetical protein